MSHIVELQTQVKDPAAIRAACERLKLPAPAQGTFRMFSGEIAGLGVELPGWRYAVVCDTASGQVRYDNFAGHWGDQKHLDAFLQAYAVEMAKLEARRKGYATTETQLADGSIRLTVQITGGIQ